MSLLRYSHFVPEKLLDTSVEKVEEAVELLLVDDTFKEIMRKILVAKIRELGRPDSVE